MLRVCVFPSQFRLTTVRVGIYRAPDFLSVRTVSIGLVPVTIYACRGRPPDPGTRLESSKIQKGVRSACLSLDKAGLRYGLVFGSALRLFLFLFLLPLLLCPLGEHLQRSQHFIHELHFPSHDLAHLILFCDGWFSRSTFH